MLPRVNLCTLYLSMYLARKQLLMSTIFVNHRNLPVKEILLDGVLSELGIDQKQVPHCVN